MLAAPVLSGSGEEDLAGESGQPEGILVVRCGNKEKPVVMEVVAGSTDSRGVDTTGALGSSWMAAGANIFT